MANLELVIPQSELIEVGNIRIEQIVNSALPHYNDDGTMLFHGPDHPVAVTNTFLHDWVKCAEHGFATDIEAGVGATAHHDDDYHLPLFKDSDYKNKEERSASIAEKDLYEIEFTPEQVALSRGAILSTNAFGKCHNLLEIQTVRADIANTEMPYKHFLKYFIRFAREKRRIDGIFTPFEEVKDVQVDILGVYFSRDLRYPFEKVCPLTVKGLANLARLKRDDEATVTAIAGEDFKTA